MTLPAYQPRTAPTGHYSNRAGRAQFAAANFAAYLSGRVLDVGCGEAFLKAHIGHYVGIDIVGAPDVRVDLERGALPFGDRSFDTVICIDVLEHLEEFNDVFAELFRVARRYVIVSLPNMYALGFRLRCLRGRVIAKEYSLMPRNRHKWLPGFSEARDFMRAWLPMKWRIKWEFGYWPPTWWRIGVVCKLWPGLFATGYWCLLERQARR